MPDAGDPTSNTPKEALVEWSAALEARDKERLLAAVHVPAETREFVEALAAIMVESLGFQEDFARVYGDEALEQFKQVHNMETGLYHASEQIGAAEMVEQGDCAAATLGGHTYKLVRVEGTWLGQMVEDLPPEANEAAGPMRIAAEVLHGMRARIGQEGTTPQDIMQEITARIMAAMPQAVAQAIPPALAAVLKSVPPEAVEALRIAAASGASDCVSALPPDLLARIGPEALHALKHLPPELLQSLSPEVLALLPPPDRDPPASTR